MLGAFAISLGGGACTDGEDACGLLDDEIVFHVVIVDDDRTGVIRVHMELREQGGGPGLLLCERRGERLMVNGSAAKSRLVQGNYAYELSYRALPETGFVIVLDRDSGRESRVLELPKLAAPELLSPEPDEEISSDGMLALTWVPANDPNVMSLQLTLRDDFGTQCLSAPLSIELADSGAYSINPASLTLDMSAKSDLEGSVCPVELELERTRELPSMPGLAMEGSAQLIARRTVSLRLR